MLPLEPTGCGGVTGGLTGDSGVFSGASPQKSPSRRESKTGKTTAADFSDFFFRFPAMGIDNRGKMC